MAASDDGDILKLISDVLHGEPDAFGPIVKKYTPLIVKLAYSFLSDREDALDASQEIFVRAYKGLASFKLEKRFEPWLYSIALNYLRTAYRARKKNAEEKKTVFREIAREQIIACANDEYDLMYAKETVRMALEELGTELREVVVLYYMEGKSVGEISEILSIGIENIKSKLFRARKKLKEIIQRNATTKKDNEYIINEGTARDELQ